MAKGDGVGAVTMPGRAKNSVLQDDFAASIIMQRDGSCRDVSRGKKTSFKMYILRRTYKMGTKVVWK